MESGSVKVTAKIDKPFESEVPIEAVDMFLQEAISFAWKGSGESFEEAAELLEKLGISIGRRLGKSTNPKLEEVDAVKYICK